MWRYLSVDINKNQLNILYDNNCIGILCNKGDN